MTAISLSANVRQSLQSLQDTAAQQAITNNHLSTGKKVSSALDNPVNFFTAASLTSRSNSLTSLLDGMSNGIQVIQAANKGLTSITSIVQQLQANVTQALQDTSSKVSPTTSANIGATTSSTAGNSSLSFKDASGNTIGSVSTFNTTWKGMTSTATLGSEAAGSIDISSASLSGAGKITVSYAANASATDIATNINSQLANAPGGSNMTAQVSNGKLQLVDKNGNNVTVTDTVASSGSTLAVFGSATPTSTAGVALTNDQIAAAVNANVNLQNKISATVSGGVLSFNNSTTGAVTIAGATSAGVTGSSSDNTITIGAGVPQKSVTRQTLANQFNTLLSQLNSVAKDSGYNGTNLLTGDKLSLVFNNLTGSDQSTLTVQNQKSDGTAFGAVNANNLGISTAISDTNSTGTDFTSNDALNSLSASLTNALTTIQNQSTALGSSLAVTQTRQDFTKGIIDVLTTGSDNLTNADMNQEAANSQALSTRNSLGISALSLANTANQGVLQLLR